MSYVCSDGRCPRCGNQLTKTKWGQYHCSNCGIFDEEQEQQIEYRDKKDISYIG